MKPELGCWGADAAVAVAELAPPKLNTEDGAAGVEVAPAPKAKGLLLAAAGFEVADPNAKGDAAAAVVTAGAAAGAAAPKENGEVAAVAAAGWLPPPAAAGVFPKENTLPVEAALVTEGNAMVGLLAAPPNEKLAAVVV